MKRLNFFLPGILGLVLCASTHAAEPYGKIGEKYAALGGHGSALGAPIGNEANAPFGGRFHDFRMGSIYWHPQIGQAFEVFGAIGGKFHQLGNAQFGYPITDESTTPDRRGRYNHFRSVQLPGKPESSIYWTPETGAHEIHGLIRDAWAKSGWERGELGYPTSDEFQDGAFRRSNFEHGYIQWSQQTGARIVKAGAAITSQAPPKTFGTLLVNGMEVSVKGRVVAGDPLFLSENAACGQWKAHLGELNAWVQGQAIARINALIAAKLHRTDVGVRTSGTHVNFSAACSFRAEVATACQNSITLRLLLPGNSFQAYLMTPVTAKDGVFGDSDPKFIVRADFDVTTSVRIPTTPGGTLSLGPSNIRILNARLESHNVTADFIKAAVEIGSQFFTGKDILDTLLQDRMFKFDSVGASLGKLSPALHSIPSNYHIDACMRSPDVFRLDGTDVVDRGPVVH
ncbi:MAG: hypothetical protein JSS42_12320 [Proteobacteria bacterium]|uniref:LGFP repeat-containing protein n=1 Tax=Rudaea sp. TaxID=2136325 RepID=UPI0032209D18|nr:hypothetical protein [Pseudomonadota bacterium]